MVFRQLILPLPHLESSGALPLGVGQNWSGNSQSVEVPNARAQRSTSKVGQQGWVPRLVLEFTTSPEWLIITQVKL